MCCGKTFFSLFNTPIVLEILFEVLFECLFQSSLVYSKCCVQLQSSLLMCNSCVESVLFVGLSYSFSRTLWGM